MFQKDKNCIKDLYNKYGMSVCISLIRYIYNIRKNQMKESQGNKR